MTTRIRLRLRLGAHPTAEIALVVAESTPVRGRGHGDRDSDDAGVPAGRAAQRMGDDRDHDDERADGRGELPRR